MKSVYETSVGTFPGFPVEKCAVLTSPSTLLKRFVTRATSAFTDFSLVVSQTSAKAFPPAFWMTATSDSAFFLLISTITTFAPWDAQRRDNSEPMSPAPPTITITLFVRSKEDFIYFLARVHFPRLSQLRQSLSIHFAPAPG